MTSFVGRRQEVAAAKKLLGHSRLVTLTGPGGIGKTRLALRVAAEVQRSFPGGVRLVQLAGLEDGDRLARAVADELRLGNASAREPEVSLAEYVADLRLLLVLDNCEHLLDACARLVSTLLAAAPGLRVLATSRQVLGLGGEQAMVVPPLSAPEPSDVPPQAGERSEAVTLFAERAVSVCPDFVLTPEKALAVARICHQLDGIPLAIELAAARLRSLSVEGILARMDERFDLLTKGSRSAAQRQRTLRALIDWSFDLCTPSERLLWARLSVFCDGFDLEAAEAVCRGQGLERRDVLDLLSALVDKSIVTCEERGTQMRYWLPTTFRQYGREHLAHCGEERMLVERHFHWYRKKADLAEADWFGSRQMSWLAWFQTEQANMRAALELCMSKPDRAESGLRMAASLWSLRLGHWLDFGSLSEARHWIAQGLALAPFPSPAGARALLVDGTLALLQGDPDTARRRMEESHETVQHLGDEPALARARVTLAGMISMFRGKFASAAGLLEEAISLHQAADDPDSVATASYLLAMVCFNLDDPATSTHAQRCLSLCETHDAKWSLNHALWVVGLEEYRSGNMRRAVTLIRQSMREKLQCGGRWGIAQSLELLGWCAAAGDRYDRSATLLGAAQAVSQLSGCDLSRWGHIKPGHDACEVLLRQELGKDGFTTAFQAGTKLTLEQAVAFALDEKRDAEPPPSDGKTIWASLTVREREVAELVSQGMTNRDVAARLVISTRTAEGHVMRILGKLGLASRAQLAAWAAKQHDC
ncbi:LuxR C-terminal-related transcriptional regulator [Streptomyces sp. SLBN-118]|uniref:ATP-binding protein n=1 Tax=Streptomyces sp. SLBN-118 TaxID=2768454 RepID=UPI00114E7EF4|nr:LuxR C-terminal-related transcriptional regulator [Streptomyces sp. SLBN-118]